MNSRLFPIPPPPHVSLALLFLILVSIPRSFAYDDWFYNCTHKLDCRNIGPLGIPLWRNDKPESCGNRQPIMPHCEGSDTIMEILDARYELLGFSKFHQILIIAEIGFAGRFCSPEPDYNNQSSLIYWIIPLSYKCGHSQIPGITDKFTCPGTKFGYDNIQFEAKTPNGYCMLSAVIPIPSYLLGADLQIVAGHIRAHFDEGDKVDAEVCRNCTLSKGICGYYWDWNQTICYCQSRSNGFEPCPSLPIPGAPAPSSGYETKTKSSKQTSLIIGVSIGGASFIGIILACCVVYCLRRKKEHPIECRSKDDSSVSSPLSNKDMPAPLLNSSQTIPSYPSSKSDLERRGSYYGVQVFSYAELEKATDNFSRSRELGDGGFGTVYYGKLRDGREVAVKRLYENNCKRVEQFMNEVDLLANLHHQNLVRLYGCTSRHQGLLLVYEYIPNGTVADHLHGRRAKSGLLSWPVRLRIAIETADALVYLHHRDVIHRDVKTNNILLDKNFTVKVADFGLSRLFPTNVTHVSTAPQGTPGYVDPEYYQCYQLTNKSDVYSFGVVLIELISSLQAVDTNRNRQDINLSNMAISKIQSRALNELIDPNLGFDKNYEVKMMTTLVAELAFRCLQHDRDMRPSMEEVLEVLRGIQSEECIVRTVEVVDIREDDAGVSTNKPPFSSRDSVIAENWVSSSTNTNSK